MLGIFETHGAARTLARFRLTGIVGVLVAATLLPPTLSSPWLRYIWGGSRHIVSALL
jgi:hypothetical protein